MKNCLENEFAWFRKENEILFFIYKDNVVIRLEEAIKIVADRLKLQQGRSFPVLCNTKGIKEMDLDARWYLATEGSMLTTAVALISDNPLSHILTNLYLQGNQPPIPTKVVSNEREGLEFLSDYINAGARH